MSDITVRNIFSKLTIEDLLIESSTVPHVTIVQSNGARLSQFFNASEGRFSKAVVISGMYSFMLFSEDLPKFISAMNDNVETFYRSNREIIQSLGYIFLNIEEVEKYKPAAGYLYNLLKESKGKNFILTRSETNKVVGVTNFDFVIRRIRQKLSEYY